MAVVVEFTIPPDAFPLGRAVSGGPDVTVNIETMVPMEQNRMPFLWASDEGSDFDQFEQTLRDSEVVKSVETLTRFADSVLYYVEWYPEETTFMNGLVESSGTIMDAHIDESAVFTVRFIDHADLTSFHRFYQEHELPIYIDRVYALSDAPGGGRNFGVDLTPSQKEALVMAVENGYFAVPRETKLEELADELDISRQALSELVRRGTEKALRRTLLELSPTDSGAADED